MANMTPLKAIKEFCFQCSGESAYEAKRCTADHCPLFPYRMGRGNPRYMSEEERAAAAERMRSYNKARGDDSG